MPRAKKIVSPADQALAMYLPQRLALARKTFPDPADAEFVEGLLRDAFAAGWSMCETLGPKP